MNTDLLALWWTGVDAVRGDIAVRHSLENSPCPPPNRIIAVGKAAVAMAKTASETWPDVPCLIVTKYDHAAGAPAGAEVVEAAHPVPDRQSLVAGAALRQAVLDCGPDDHLLMLVSGGASALAEALAADDTLERLQADTQARLASGATIAELNAFRRERSLIKGGKLLAAFPGRLVTTLAISDVEGDALAVIGSGIGDAPAGAPFDFDPRIVASNAIARDAIAKAAGDAVVTNAENLYSDVSELAPEIAGTVRDGPSGLYVFGGEPVVTLPEEPGAGGRNMCLGAMIAAEIAGRSDVQVLVAGTDGTDGPTDAAGALVTGQTWDQGGPAAIAAADTYPWLGSRGALVKTGPTGTNVMDLVIAQKT